jgi:hypothetical protein
MELNLKVALHRSVALINAKGPVASYTRTLGYANLNGKYESVQEARIFLSVRDSLMKQRVATMLSHARSAAVHDRVGDLEAFVAADEDLNQVALALRGNSCLRFGVGGADLAVLEVEITFAPVGPEHPDGRGTATPADHAEPARALSL